MKKISLILMIIAILTKGLGFLREVILAYYYGASNITDAYIVAFLIPSVVLGFIATGISIGYMPIYNKVSLLHGEGRGNLFTSNLINATILLCTVLIAITYIFAAPIVKVFASGFDEATVALAVRLTRIGLIAMYFEATVPIVTSFLNAKKKYVMPAFVGIPMNLLTIVAIIISSKFHIVILAIGAVFATASQLLVVLPLAYRNDLRLKLNLHLHDIYLKELFLMVMPVIIGISINQINVLVDRTIASRIAVGGISALNYANKLNVFVQGIFVMSIVTVLYPRISKMAVENNMKGFKKYISEAISSVNLFVVPATIGMMFFAEPIVRLLFGRGKFDEYAVSITSSALFFYALGIIGFGLREILSRAFYAIQDTKTPAINAAIAVVINIVLNIILSRFMGIGGLALATSISAIICTGLLFVSLRRKIGSFGLKGILTSFLKITVASLTMGMISRLFFGLLMGIVSQNLSLMLSIVIGVVSYMIIIYFMKIEDVDNMMSMVKAKINNR